jgi:hypothetical protein
MKANSDYTNMPNNISKINTLNDLIEFWYSIYTSDEDNDDY